MAGNISIHEIRGHMETMRTIDRLNLANKRYIFYKSMGKRDYQGNYPGPKRQKMMKQKSKSKYPLKIVGSLKPELKWFDSSSTTMPALAAQTWTTLDMSNMVAGTGTSNVVGGKALLKKAYFRARFHCAATTTGSETIRVIMTYGDQALTSVLASNDHDAMVDLTTTTDNCILYDKTKTISVNGNGSVFFKGYCKLNHIWETGGRNISIGWSHSGTLGTTTITGQVDGRVRFLDA